MKSNKCLKKKWPISTTTDTKQFERDEHTVLTHQKPSRAEETSTTQKAMNSEAKATGLDKARGSSRRFLSVATYMCL